MNNLEKQKFLHDYAESVKNKTIDELKAMEQELIAEAEKVDDDTKNTEFAVPSENYKTVAQAIRLLINKVKCQWSLTLGLVAMYDFWDPEKRPSVVVYPMLDGTLRTLGNLEFEGYDEWAAVVAVNKFFEPLRQQYIDATEKIYDVAAKHDVVLSQMQLLLPAEDANEIPDSIDVE